MIDKHTPTPWKRSEENAYSILTPQGGLIAKTSYHWVDPVSARLNAAFIVKACNSHEELVHSVQNLLDDIDALQRVDDLALSVGRSRSWFSVLRANSLLDEIRAS